MAAITRLLALPGVGVLLLIKTVCGVPIGILQSMFSVGKNLLLIKSNKPIKRAFLYSDNRIHSIVTVVYCDKLLIVTALTYN